MAADNSGEQPTSAVGTSETSTSDEEDSVKLPEIEVPEQPLSKTVRQVMWSELYKAENKLQAAIEASDAAKTEQFRARITELQAMDPYFAVRAAAEAAFAKEEFFTAAKLRLVMDKLGTPRNVLKDGTILPDPPKKKKAPPKNRPDDADAAGPKKPPAKPDEKRPPMMRGSGGLAAAGGPSKGPVKPGSGDKLGGGGEEDVLYTNHSDTTTNGIRVQIYSKYYPEESKPSEDRYVFVYKVKISNGSPMTVQLVSRTWEIRTLDSKGNKPIVAEVKGAGVVGQQPVIEPGQSFEYSSVSPLSQSPREGFRVLGRMTGSYSMVCGAQGEKGFDVKIDPFYLILPEDLVGPSK